MKQLKPSHLLFILLCMLQATALRAQHTTGQNEQPASNIITMTTAKQVGETISLRIYTNGAYTVEGAENPVKREDGYTTYTLVSQTVTVKGDVTTFACRNNQLQTLDASNNTTLTSLDCSHNRLHTLNVSKSMGLTQLICHDNQIKEASMDQLIASLPIRPTQIVDRCPFPVFNTTSSTEGNVCTRSQVAAARIRGWLAMTSLNGEPYEGSDHVLAIDRTTATHTRQGVQAVFDMQGRPQSHLRKGVNIVRMADGTMRKLMKP